MEDPNGAVTYALTVRSPAPPEQVRLLVEHAERACHATQSLRQPDPVFSDDYYCRPHAHGLRNEITARRR